MLNKSQLYEKIKDKNILDLLRNTRYFLYLREPNGLYVHKLITLQTVFSLYERNILNRKNNDMTVEQYKDNHQKEFNNTLQALLESTEFGARF
ncbi:MAG: hypothetical protein AABW65_03600 [Nanoarchaeota archaeon]